MLNRVSLGTLVLAATLAAGSLAHAQNQDSASSNSVLELRKEIDQLKSKIAETDEKAEAAIEELENKGQGTTSSSGSSWADNTQLGGYGELHYNAGERDQIDFHRFVLFINHQFSDRLRFFSELEVEHSFAADGAPGAVELEQAYIEFDLDDRNRLFGGVFLIPVGILNEVHEPDTFFGVERNPVENAIIPTTWWTGGLGARGELGDESGFFYDLAFHSGLLVNTDTFTPRSGRQRVAEAVAEDGAVTGRLRWKGISGVELGFTALYQNDLAQGEASDKSDAVLLNGNLNIRRGIFGLRALYAYWDINGEDAAALGADEQFGWYVEPSLRFETGIGDVGVFARYNAFDNSANSEEDSENEQIDVGLNYWPHERVVLKADVAFIDQASGEDDNRLNLGIGYQF